MPAGAQSRRGGQRKLRGFFLRALRSRKSIADVPPFFPGSGDVRGRGQERPGQTPAAAVAATVAAASETEVNPIPEQRPPMPRTLVVHLTGKVLLVVLVVAVAVFLLFEAVRLVVSGGGCLAWRCRNCKVESAAATAARQRRAPRAPAAAAGGEGSADSLRSQGQRGVGRSAGHARPASSALLIRNSFVSVLASFFSSSSSFLLLLLPGFVVVGVLRCFCLFFFVPCVRVELADRR